MDAKEGLRNSLKHAEAGLAALERKREELEKNYQDQLRGVERLRARIADPFDGITPGASFAVAIPTTDPFVVPDALVAFSLGEYESDGTPLFRLHLVGNGSFERRFRSGEYPLMTSFIAQGHWNYVFGVAKRYYARLAKTGKDEK